MIQTLLILLFINVLYSYVIYCPVYINLTNSNIQKYLIMYKYDEYTYIDKSDAVEFVKIEVDTIISYYMMNLHSKYIRCYDKSPKMFIDDTQYREKYISNFLHYKVASDVYSDQNDCMTVNYWVYAFFVAVLIITIILLVICGLFGMISYMFKEYTYRKNK